MIATALYFGPSKNSTVVGNNQAPQVAARQAPAQVGTVKPVDFATDHIRGDKNAKVFVIEYSDFECPFCKRFHPTMQQLFDQTTQLIYIFSKELSIVTKKQFIQKLAFTTFGLISLIVVGILFAILGFIIVRGISVVNWEFLTAMPEDGMTKGGIFPAIVGTGCLVLGSMVFAFPIGVLSGIYTNEYLKDTWFKRFIRVMTNNLSGIPSIVFGLFGMALFVNYLEFGDSILAGSLTLGLLTLPVVIRTTEEALKSVDDSLRLGSYALGATKLQTIRRVVLPVAYPNIITGLS